MNTEFCTVFSNILKDTQIHNLADSDEQEVVQQIQVTLSLTKRCFAFTKKKKLWLIFYFTVFHFSYSENSYSAQIWKYIIIENGMKTWEKMGKLIVSLARHCHRLAFMGLVKHGPNCCSDA